MSRGIGIELSPAAVRAVVLEGVARDPKGRVKVLSSRELACETANPDALTQALIQLRRALSVTQPVVLGMPSTSAFLTTVTPLIPNPHRASLAVQFELQQHLPFELADAAWHYRWLSQDGQPRAGGAPAPATVTGGPGGRGARGAGQLPTALSPQRSSTAVVAAMKRSLLDERLACCRRAGLSILAVAVNPVATLNAWETQSVGTATGPVVLLNLLNDPTAEWVVRTATQLSVMPVASGLPQTPAADAGNAAEAFLQELAASWAALQQQFADLPRKIWLLGAAAAMPRLAEAIAAQLRVEVEEMRLTRAVALNTAIEHIERWTAAIGLGLQGLGIAPVPLNLLDRAQSDEQVRTVQRVAAVGSAVLAVAALGIGVSGMMEVRSRRASILASLDTEERLYRTLRPKAQALLRAQQRLQERSDSLERLVAERAVLTRLLAQVSEALPERVWLTKLECAKNGRLEGMLEGRATSFQDVTQFLDRLKTVAGMTNIKPLATTVIADPGTGQELIAFSVQIERQAAAAPAATPEEEPPASPAEPKRKGATRR